mgnify:CR=1 FL=1
MKTFRIKNIWIWGIGLIALCVLIVRIYASFTQKDVPMSFSTILSRKNSLYLIMACILMPINWLIEAWKWYKVSRLVEKTSFKNAFFSVLTGLAYGHLLPGRSSEFLGKLLFFSDRNKFNITVLHFVNAAFQMYITIVIGLLLFLIAHLHSKIFTTTQPDYVFGFAVLLFVLFTLFIVYADKLYFLKKFLPSLSYEMSHTLKVELLGWSLVRYFIFVLQFFYVFKWLDDSQVLNLSFLSSLSLYFLITSVIPMMSVIEVAVRSLIAIWTFQNTGMNDVQLIIITTIIWLINLVIPSFWGFLIWMRKLRNPVYQNKE